MNKEGKFAPVMDFILHYEEASWQEVSRQMVLLNIDINHVYEAYVGSLKWYRTLFAE